MSQNKDIVIRLAEFHNLNINIMQAIYEDVMIRTVRESIEVCESMQLIGPYKEVQDATLKDLSMQIKQHFGVKE
jgi:hypothetical protein